MNNNKTFSIDLTSLYEYIGNGKTEFGYYIEHEEDGMNTWNDLRQACPNTLFACDGETCSIIEEFENSVHIYNDENIPFWLSKDEFNVCCNYVELV
jgi:hypothetical protein